MTSYVCSSRHLRSPRGKNLEGRTCCLKIYFAVSVGKWRKMEKDDHKTTGRREIITCRVTQNKKVAMDWYAFEVSPSNSFAALFEGLVLASQYEHGRRFKTKIAKDIACPIKVKLIFNFSSRCFNYYATANNK